MRNYITNRLNARAVWAVAALVVILCLFSLLPRDPKAYITTSMTCDARVPNGAIPNYVHFVYILPDSSKDFNFEFSHFLSIYAAWFYWRPDSIFLHTNVRAGSESIVRARQGLAGKWNKLIFTLFDIQINTVEVPTHAGNGVEIQGMEHKSDFVRVKAVYEFGGIYIDWDVHALRDIRPLRESGFKAIAGRQLGGQVNSGTFMSVKHGKMIKLWMDGMNVAYTGGWTTHSNEIITKYSQRLVREAGEMLIMERDAFAPGSWNNDDTDDLFGLRDGPSNLADISQGDPLPSFDESFSDRWDHPDRYPSWARDWSHTYLMHAFAPNRWGHKVDGFEHITPRYVLNRTSNFALAVYPVASHMYAEGLIGLDDSHVGK
ncbi:Glycosyl transferase [Madurella fahalii]|uniref:Glycosyl transferase n=1 Tax=Madurella fahalii TaxID=1157608 RepID=A0ABQ0FZ87_9PEZI